MKKILIAAPSVAAGFAGAYWLAAHASNETVIALAGIAGGILASIPIAILVLIALTRERPTPAAMPPRDAAKQWSVTPPAQLSPGSTIEPRERGETRA